MGFLDDWELTFDDINEITTANPSLQSFAIGYAAEVKCRRQFFDDHRDIFDVYKPDDHDRAEKGDWIVRYRGERMAVEVKSLQASSLRPRKRDGRVIPKYQCDASDRRVVEFDDGSSVQTTALLVGEFDVVAVNLRALTGGWDFVFCKNQDLPRMERSHHTAHYTDYQLDNLIKTMPTPALTRHHTARPPYSDDPYSLFDEIIDERRKGTAPKLRAVEIDDDETQRSDREER